MGMVLGDQAHQAEFIQYKDQSYAFQKTKCGISLLSQGIKLFFSSRYCT